MFRWDLFPSYFLTNEAGLGLVAFQCESKTKPTEMSVQVREAIVQLKKWICQRERLPNQQLSTFLKREKHWQGEKHLKAYRIICQGGDNIVAWARMAASLLRLWLQQDKFWGVQVCILCSDWAKFYKTDQTVFHSAKKSISHKWS